MSRTPPTLLNRRSALALALLAPAAAWPAPLLAGLDARWLDDRGQAFVWSSLQGRWTVVTMAYGACRRICSTSLRVMQQVQALADRQGLALDFVVAGLDPEADKPADWAAFRATQRLQRGNWHFLAGDAEAVRATAARLGIRYWRYGEHVMHDFRIALISPEGESVRTMTAFDQPPALLLPPA